MKHDSRNLKYGSTAIIVSAVLIFSIIMINAIFTALSSKYAFYSDMTKKQTYTLSNETKEVLSDITENVEIIFCNDRDKIYENLNEILLTAENLNDEYEWLSIKFVNIIKNPLEVKAYQASSEDTINPTDVIIRSGEEYKRLKQENFYVFDSDGTTIWGFQAEEQFASAILSVTAAETPVAYYTSSHLENVPTALLDTITKAGYEVKSIDLALEDISPDARLVIISNPKKDFSGGEGSELEKLDKFLSQDFGSLICFLDPVADDLKNLEAYLYEWGVVFENNTVKNTSLSVSADGQSVVAEYCTDNTTGSTLIDEFAALATRPKPIFEDAGTISVNPNFSLNREYDESEENGLGTPTGSYVSGYRDISPVFVAADGTVSYAVGEENGTALDAADAYLMTVSRQTVAIGDDYFSSYVLCANTAMFCNEQWVVSNTYANNDVLYAALKQFGREKVPSGIDYKELASYTIEDMTNGEANSWSIILITVLPISFALVGTVICIRRKYR